MSTRDFHVFVHTDLGRWLRTKMMVYTFPLAAHLLIFACGYRLHLLTTKKKILNIKRKTLRSFAESLLDQFIHEWSKSPDGGESN